MEIYMKKVIDLEEEWVKAMERKECTQKYIELYIYCNEIYLDIF